MDSSLREAIGSKIRFLRKTRGLTQADLAEKMEGDIVQLSRYERGINAPGIEHLLKIAQALEIPPADLLPTLTDLRMEQMHRLRQILSEKALKIRSPETMKNLILQADLLIEADIN